MASTPLQADSHSKTLVPVTLRAVVGIQMEPWASAPCSPVRGWVQAGDSGTQLLLCHEVALCSQGVLGKREGGCLADGICLLESLFP